MEDVQFEETTIVDFLFGSVNIVIMNFGRYALAECVEFVLLTPRANTDGSRA